MNRIIVGLDPDTKAHGVAVYVNGLLTELCNLTLVDIIKRFEDNTWSNSEDGFLIEFAIEDVSSNKFQYNRHVTGKAKIDKEKIRNVGRCQHSQIEVERYLDYLNVKFTRYPPQEGNFAKSKALFQRCTGWKKRSNEDTRSGAFFGFLHHQHLNIPIKKVAQ